MFSQWKKLPLLVQWTITIITMFVTVIVIAIIFKFDTFDDSVLLERAKANGKHILAKEFCYDGVTYITFGIHAGTVKLNQQGQVILCK